MIVNPCCRENKHDKGACVGRYVVNVDSFEQSLKLIFENEVDKSLLTLEKQPEKKRNPL